MCYEGEGVEGIILKKLPQKLVPNQNNPPKISYPPNKSKEMFCTSPPPTKKIHERIKDITMNYGQVQTSEYF